MRVRPAAILSAIAISGLTIATASYAYQQASEADKVFTGNVSQGGMYEVEASKVAVQRAVAQDVKDVAATEVHDHELVNGYLKTLAMKSEIPISATLNDTLQQRLSALKSASASGFDDAYITDMKSIHDKDEKLFAKEAKEGSDSFKVFAHQTDLIVKRHIGALHGVDGY